MSHIRTHLTYANVMSTIAAAAALGTGTVYAAATIGSKQIKNNSVASVDVKNGSLLAKDFKAGQLPAGATGSKGDTGDTGANGATGPAGPKGDTGAKGDTGTAGTNAATSTVIRRATTGVLADNADGGATATCLGDEKLVGGGGGFIAAITDTLTPHSRVSWSGPTNAGGDTPVGDQTAASSWTIKGRNLNSNGVGGGFGERIVAYAICVSP
jgi:hypothetical protein